jgi:DNA helicase-2/ATP-dependent DNA helicase PcrA
MSTVELDHSQAAFCNAESGDIRLLAPAGCGKTQSLLYRCLSLSQSSENQRIRFLMVTFTVAARQELAARINDDPAFASIRDQVDVTTLNSWGFRRIKSRYNAPKLIATKSDQHFNFQNPLRPIWTKHAKIKQVVEAKKVIAPKKIMKIMDTLKTLGFDHIAHTNFEQFQEQVSALASQGLLSMFQSHVIDELGKLKILDSKVTTKGDEQLISNDRKVYNNFFRFWREAVSHLIECALFTLEDQKYVAYLDEKEKVEQGMNYKGVTKYDHILVDEFQDINPLDLNLIKAIANRNNAFVTIVGDDDQSLYEWRGATPNYILDPDTYFGRNFATYKLETNYRSPANIVSMSQSLISHNQRRVEKEIKPYLSNKADIDIIKTSGLANQLDVVYNIISPILQDASSSSKVAIVGRIRGQIIPYQIYLASKNIPFCAAEDLQVFLSQAFDKLVDLLALKTRSQIRQNRSAVATDMLKLCDQVKRYPLSKDDRSKLQYCFLSNKCSTVSEAVEALRAYKGPLKGKKQGDSISTQMADAIAAFVNANSVSKSIEALGDSFDGLQVDIGKAEDDIFYVDPPFASLAEFAVNYKDDFDAFIDDIESAKEKLVHLPPVDEDSSSALFSDLWKRPVHLMTALRTKGKEFDYVILLDVIDGVWPNKNATTIEGKEAERRVFYVAFTRVKQKLVVLTSSKFRGKNCNPSPYLAELGINYDDLTA